MSFHKKIPPLGCARHQHRCRDSNTTKSGRGFVVPAQLSGHHELLLDTSEHPSDLQSSCLNKQNWKFPLPGFKTNLSFHLLGPGTTVFTSQILVHPSDRQQGERFPSAWGFKGVCSSRGSQVLVSSCKTRSHWGFLDVFQLPPAFLYCVSFVPAEK